MNTLTTFLWKNLIEDFAIPKLYSAKGKIKQN